MRLVLAAVAKRTVVASEILQFERHVRMIGLPFWLLSVAAVWTFDAAECEQVLRDSIQGRAFPGCTVQVGSDQQPFWTAAFGYHDYSDATPVTVDAIYDLASVTKVAGTTTVLMRLVALGKVRLDDPIGRWLPEFLADTPDPEQRAQRERVTVEHLLTHSSGLGPWRPFHQQVDSYTDLIAEACRVPLVAEPGESHRYSDIGLMLAGEVAARAGGRPLAELERELVFDPLGMTNTWRCPPAELLSRIPPTEIDAATGELVHGVVHDENARAGEGQTGHAGLFATAEDLGKLAAELLRAARGQSRLFPRQVVEQFFEPRQVGGIRRAVGWNIVPDSGGRLLSHTGFTGTSMQLDLRRNRYIVLLTNRVHPTRDNQQIGRVRREVRAAVERQFESMDHPGIERQFAELQQTLEGKRVGLLTNPSSVDAEYRFLADRLHASSQVTLVCLFAPEHGLRGDRQAGQKVQDYVDDATGLPVYSLYSQRRIPTPEQLAEFDVLLCDLQDVGARFYTFVWTVVSVMEAAARENKRVVIFDRPNPIGLAHMEGAPTRLNAGLVGPVWSGQPFGVPTRHGMTVGEIATLVNEAWAENKADLTVVRVPGYSRSTRFVETGYPWVMPSPNMPTLDTAAVYPGTCVFEGTNLSEGRGTTRPFELIGAPFVQPRRVVARLNDAGLPGVRFREAWFTPTFEDHADQLCGGVQVHVTDPDAFQPVRTGLVMLKAFCDLYPKQVTVTSFASRLMGVPDLHHRIWTESADSLIDDWQADLLEFQQLRQPYLLYPESLQP
jgi:uncharacterized protein YbbC (DUF1343 family)